MVRDEGRILSRRPPRGAAVGAVSQHWVVGGPAVVRDFFKQKLVQEIRLSILPVALGGGLPFFARLAAQVPLHLKVTSYKSGIVELWYEVRGAGGASRV